MLSVVKVCARPAGAAGATVVEPEVSRVGLVSGAVVVFFLVLVLSDVFMFFSCLLLVQQNDLSLRNLMVEHLLLTMRTLQKRPYFVQIFNWAYTAALRASLYLAICLIHAGQSKSDTTAEALTFIKRKYLSLIHI